MQPYFLPYIGYWQLMHHVDCFVVYDDIEYTKRGWINRNRFLREGQAVYFTLPIEKASDYLDIRERRLSDKWPETRLRIQRKFALAYARAPYFSEGMRLFEEAAESADRNLFSFLWASLFAVRDKVSIKTEIIRSTSVQVSSHLRGAERVIAMCQELGATRYLNPIGGLDLYEKSTFAQAGVELGFQRVLTREYPQLQHSFVPNLSILDMVMFTGFGGVRARLDAMELI